MTKQAHAARVQLAEEADRLIREVAAGEWDHVAEIQVSPVGEWPLVVASLASACPGFSIVQYQEALRRSFRDNR
ncbi:hypothetical protein [Novilysobacter selenitireducens]|uniref:Uncharacterized protein n=1 Tax=Novilysobacter selenitireducens TaxID=2872639 RepID=A0ABS7T609_9GAMM|nr:hypothetical protein [Lysobacter selenitireducens]MBZ4039312.1 hypothetical protein [Lysobacter selenitireducens]